MIVNSTVVAMLGAGGCGVATTPIVGTSPANAGMERATTSVAAIASRFMISPPVRDCQTFYIGNLTKRAMFLAR